MLLQMPVNETSKKGKVRLKGRMGINGGEWDLRAPKKKATPRGDAENAELL